MLDADDLHPKANVDKMSRGEPLTDLDREPWLELVRKTAEHICTEQQVSDSNKKLAGVVIACSALKKYYRDILRGTYRPNAVPSYMEPPDPRILPTCIIYISGPRDLLETRMKSRRNHFMKASMLESQLRTLESPEGEEGVITVMLEDTTETQVKVAREAVLGMLEQRKVD